MKKGCFLTTIIFGTVIIGILFYVIDRYGNDISLFFEDKVYEITADSVDDFVSKIVNENKKELLTKNWDKAYSKAKEMKFDEGMQYLSTIISKIEYFTKDSLLTENELKSIEELVENETK